MAITLKVNEQSCTIDVPGEMPLLWVLRNVLGLKGTKYGCGISACGACTVHVDGRAVRSCVTPVSSVESRNITTIEGLEIERRSIPFKWLGKKLMCLSAVIVSQVRLCPRWRCSRKRPSPRDTDIDSAMSGNLCRCGTYPRIREAIHRAAEMQTAKGGAR